MDLSLAEKRLNYCTDYEELDTVADKVLEISELSMTAWDCKYVVAKEYGDMRGMVEAKYRYLLLNRYDEDEYAQFDALLAEAMADASPEELTEYQRYVELAKTQLERVIAETSPLAWRIAEQPSALFQNK